MQQTPAKMSNQRRATAHRLINRTDIFNGDIIIRGSTTALQEASTPSPKAAWRCSHF
jgi:hypothetical protein